MTFFFFFAQLIPVLLRSQISCVYTIILSMTTGRLFFFKLSKQFMFTYPTMSRTTSILFSSIFLLFFIHSSIHPFLPPSIQMRSLCITCCWRTLNFQHIPLAQICMLVTGSPMYSVCSLSTKCHSSMHNYMYEFDIVYLIWAKDFQTIFK